MAHLAAKGWVQNSTGWTCVETPNQPWGIKADLYSTELLHGHMHPNIAARLALGCQGLDRQPHMSQQGS